MTFVETPTAYRAGWRALGAMAVAAAISLLAAQAAPASDFTFAQPGYAQSIYGVGPEPFGGVAFLQDGDPIVDFCTRDGGGDVRRFESSSTVTVHATTIHPSDTVGSDGAGCGLASNPDGFVYTNTTSGVVRLSGSSGRRFSGFYGLPGNGLGIAIDPQTNDLVYAGEGGELRAVDPTFSLRYTFSSALAGRLVGGIAFDPTGEILFVADRSVADYRLTILRRDGSVVQSIPLASEPAGIAFHVTPKFVVATNLDGTITRYDFPGDDFTQAPVSSVLASGGFGGDFVGVGPDGCLYASQQGTRYDDGFVTGESSLAKLCGGFATPPGTGGGPPSEGLLAHYRLNEPSGSQLLDSAAGHHDGSCQNGVANGLPGAQALDPGDKARGFNGLAAYCYVNGLTAPTRAYTLEGWMKLASQRPGTIADHGGAGAIYVKADRFCMRNAWDANRCWVQTPQVGRYYHVAMTWSDSDRVARLYVDGVLRLSATSTASPSGTSTFYVGYGQSAPWFDGALDEIRYFSTALSAMQVLAHYNAACRC